MTEIFDVVAQSAGTIVLALMAGAGGSALLELLWRPRRDCRRASALLLAEVALNTELLILQAFAREKNLLGIPSDFRMSTIAWDAASGLVSELPPKAIRALVQLYAKYRALNLRVEEFGHLLTVLEASAPGTKAHADAETMVARTIDVFNTGLDSTLVDGQLLLPTLQNLSAIKESAAEKSHPAELQRIAHDHMDKRAVATDAVKMAARRHPPPADPAA